MPDIMKFIRNRGAEQTDPEGHLLETEEWSEAKAKQRASEEGIALSDAHWEVIHFVRGHYREHGEMASARLLLDAMEKRFQNEGGKKYLYQLFPNGPVRQSTRIAGVPVPEYSSDPSFGTSQ